MHEEKIPKDICPYCLSSISSESMDHIFPQFLGGTAKISACKKCNNSFGHTFEAKVSKILLPLYYLLYGWGLKPKNQSPALQLGHLESDNTYKLFIAEGEMKYSLARPVIKRDENGEILSGKFTEQKDVDEFVKNLISKGKAKEMIVAKEATSDVNATGLDYTIEIGPDIRRLALKMCLSLATKLKDFDLEEVADARSFLTGEHSQEEVDIVLPAYDVYDDVDSLRKGLSHVIYVERGETYISGLIQFYGHLQFFCHLGIANASAKQDAVFASLDPITGQELFSSIRPLKLEEPPYEIDMKDFHLFLDGWMLKFKEEATARGAINPTLKQGNSFIKEK